MLTLEPGLARLNLTHYFFTLGIGTKDFPHLHEIILIFNYF